MADDKRIVAQLDQLSVCPPTPPQTTSPDSPTPSEALPISGVNRIIAELRSRCRGQLGEDEEWWCVNLSIDDFKSLEESIEAHEDLHDIKYDYFPRLTKFVLRMADDLHEVVIGQLKAKIQQQLFIIQQGNDQLAADFARKILARGSPKVVDEGYMRHVPDGSFAHRDARRLGVVLEVSYSQKRKDLPFLADDYILGSHGLTQVVIGIDLEYRENMGMEAKVMVWRPRYTQEADGKHILEAAQTFEGTFRARNGSSVNRERILRIRLKDFGNQHDCPGINNISGEVTISFSQLYDIVQEGEAVKQTVKRGLDDVAVPENQKRPRLRSPPEELRAEDEKRFQAAEEEADRQLSDHDSDYIP